jgi:hypothetical protein
MFYLLSVAVSKIQVDKETMPDALGSKIISGSPQPILQRVRHM